MAKSVRALLVAVTIAVTPTCAFGLESSTVNIALIDMTAVMPGFAGQGLSTLGQGGVGMMGRGGFGQMTPGWGGGGFGQGMMGGYGPFGPGFAPGMMGMMGMMGQGMMGFGMMTIRADVPSVKAGPVTFNVINWSRSVVHEMAVIAVDDPAAALPYDYNRQVVVEDQVNMLGETEELAPNASEALTLDLPAGNYLLICNIPGHYGSGMQMSFTVTQ